MEETGRPLRRAHTAMIAARVSRRSPVLQSRLLSLGRHRWTWTRRSRRRSRADSLFLFLSCLGFIQRRRQMDSLSHFGFRAGWTGRVDSLSFAIILPHRSCFVWAWAFLFCICDVYEEQYHTFSSWQDPVRAPWLTCVCLVCLKKSSFSSPEA
jgi:hypothetical protein